MSFLISSASAADVTTTIATAAAPASPYSSIFLMIGFVVIFYFLFIRPQSKRAKEHRTMVANLQVDDVVATNGGIVGIICSLEDNFIVLRIAKGVEIKLQKNAIASALPKGTVEFN